jgi:hypothetical protein
MQPPTNEDFELALSKLAGLVPDKLSQEDLKTKVVDRIPKAFYYQLLIDLLLKETDKRPAELILTEAKFIARLLTFTLEKKNPITQPQTQI